MNEEKQEIPAWNVLSGAFQISVLFLPVMFLNEIVSWLIDSRILLYLIVLLPAVVSFLAVFSRNMRRAGLKWLVSVPFTGIWFLFFRLSGFKFIFFIVCRNVSLNE